MILNRVRKYLLCAFIVTVCCACHTINGVKPSADSSDRKLVCEIVRDAWGPIYPPGRTLILRVFDNGEFEFDFYPQYGPDRVGMPFTFEVKTGVLSSTDLAVFQSAVRELDVQNVQTEYQPTKPILDSRIIVIVSFSSSKGNTEIRIEENDSHLQLERGPYSPALKRLLHLAYQIHFDNRKKLLEADGAN